MSLLPLLIRLVVAEATILIAPVIVFSGTSPMTVLRL